MRIGILGAGQLGRMLALAGYPLDFDFVFLDPATEACAAPLGEHIHAAYDDPRALAEFCARVDLATYEFENVPAATADFVAARTRLLPPPRALSASQDRLSEKRLFEALDMPLPPYAPVDTREELLAAIARIGLPAVLKTRRLGYDGKGQALLRNSSDIAPAWSRLSGQPLILERFVLLTREVSLLGVRGREGELAFYPLTENAHRDGILRSARPRPDDALQPVAELYAQRVLEHLDYVGVLAFEFFAADGELLANEIAPRVHNSGHWTIEGAECSQFENHLRAIAGLPLGSVRLRGRSALLNIISAAPPHAAVAAIPGVHLHLYSKQPKPLRKIGHVTVVADTDEELEQRLSRLAALIGG